ncbi:hypothetical protein [Amycolatopsis pithecellobii]|uniref:Uncharacterized protein n=1 Tax=Amycolatopsis pithecellobii TaxID=664692 RepID=A0A6N7Z718_9PSEU|nr:hypothetical protein [Amycolatopsis pithecellobii]MTD56864.1 hypothetical protein [Amycolatopsis pithecellobii]
MFDEIGRDGGEMPYTGEMPYSVALVVPAMVGGVIAAGVVFLLIRRRVSGRDSKLAAAMAGLAFALGWYFAAWMALLGVIVAAVVYGMARLFTRAGQAAVAAFGAYLVFTAGAGYMLSVALDSMG